jgi:RNA-directed DNA polymerase
MPEDAPGNPGAGRTEPPARQVAAYRKVREMQAKLHRWAGEDPSRRFGDLFNLVCDLEFLAEAWLRVKQNKGSRTPGIDGATVAQIENRPGGVGVFLEDIRAALKSGGFRPDPVRQVMIPKKSGKLRSLGIATVTSYCPSCRHVSECSGLVLVRLCWRICWHEHGSWCRHLRGGLSGGGVRCAGLRG